MNIAVKATLLILPNIKKYLGNSDSCQPRINDVLTDRKPKVTY